jgi:2-iminobutanoate/2-iminopropanoate deaminase
MNSHRKVEPSGIYKPASYEHAMWAGDLLFVAGQVARDADGVLVAAGDARAQAVQVYANLSSVLEAAGVRRDQVVKIVTYLVDAGDAPAVGEIRQRFFGRHLPPHTGIVVAALGGPDVRVEVEVVAYAPTQQEES